jgi:hypothetical protein
LASLGILIKKPLRANSKMVSKKVMEYTRMKMVLYILAGGLEINSMA